MPPTAARRTVPALAVLALTVALGALLLPGAATAAPRPCPNAGVTRGLVALDGPHVRVWHRPADARAAAAYRTAVEGRIWPRFRALLGRTPPSDAGVRRCRNGGDGRLDLYVVRAHRDLSGARVAAFRPYSGEPCDPRKPGVVLMKRGARRAVVAHEIFHAFQAAYRRATDCIDYSFWDEATATWAMDLAYPNDQDEHLHRGNTRLDYPVALAPGYGGWLYVYAMAKMHGSGVVRRIHQAQERLPEIRALDAAIPGGAAKSFQDHAALAWNRAPLPGTSVGRSFRQWDRYAPPGGPVVENRLDLGGLATVSIPLVEGVRTRATDVRRITVPDDVRFVDIAPGVIDDEDARVGAFVNRGGAWEYEDWTARTRVTFCRDLPGQDVREVVMLTTNAVVGDPEPLRPHGRIDGDRGCVPKTITGTISGTVDTTTGYTLSWSGPVTFTLASPDALGYDYDVTAAAITWNASIGAPSVCSGSGSGTVGTELVTGRLSLDPTPNAAGTGWRYDAGVQARFVPSGGMRFSAFCAFDPPRTVVQNAADLVGQNGEGAFLSTGYSTGQPATNGYTTDMRTFRGAVVTIPSPANDDQTWNWDLLGATDPSVPAPERPDPDTGG